MVSPGKVIGFKLKVRCKLAGLVIREAQIREGFLTTLGEFSKDINYVNGIPEFQC
jgi:hypothetical protein